MSDSKKGQHKFVWSTPIDAYTLAAVCEYCGLISFHSNNTNKTDERQKLAQEPCKRNNGEKVN